MDDIKQHNIRRLYVEAALSGLIVGLPQTFIPVFALRLGAPSQVIGLLTALPSLVNALWLIPSAHLIEQQQRLLVPLLVSGFLHGAQYILVALIPAIPAPWQTPTLLAIVALGAMPIGVYNVVINAVLADIVPKGSRGPVLGNRNLLLTLTEVVALALAGWFLSALPLPLNYQMLFLFVFCCSLINITVLHNLDVHRTPASVETTRPVSLSLQNLRRLVRDDGESQAFGRFLLAAFVLLFSGWLPRPLFSIYWVRNLQVTDSWVGTLTAISAIVSMVGYPVWGRIAEQQGNRWLLLVGSLGYTLYPTLTALSPSPAFLIIPTIVGGLLTPPYTLGLLNGLLDVAPVQHRATYIAVYTAVSNFASFAAPILSTGFILPLIGIRATLILGSGVRFLGWVAVYLLVKKPSLS